VGGVRPASQVEVAIGASADGDWLGLTCSAYTESGAATGSVVAAAAHGMYDSPNKDLDDYDVVVHSPPARAMGGRGAPAALFGLETAVDVVAERLGVDPIALRQKWDADDEVRGYLYAWAAGLPVVQGLGPAGAETGRYRRGVGI